MLARTICGNEVFTNCDQSICVVDCAWDGVGLVLSGTFCLGRGREVGGVGAWSDYVGDGVDPAGEGFFAGAEITVVDWIGGGVPICDHAGEWILAGEGVCLVDGIGSGLDIGELLSGRDGVERDRLFGAGKRAVVGFDDDVFDFTSGGFDACTDEGICGSDRAG